MPVENQRMHFTGTSDDASMLSGAMRFHHSINMHCVKNLIIESGGESSEKPGERSRKDGFLEALGKYLPLENTLSIML